MSKKINFKTETKRENWIDVLRGIAIFLVILGHSIPEEKTFFAYTSAIKMPLFFFISGFLFSLRFRTKTYLKKIFFRLIIPWFTLSLFPYIVKPSRLIEIFILLLTGEKAWFMLTFTIDSILVYFLLKLIKNINITIIISFFLAGLGLFLTKIDSPNIFCINTIFTTQFFIISAFYFKSLYQKLAPHVIIGWICMILYIITCYIGFKIYMDIIDVHTNHYFNIYICLLMILFGNISIFIIGNYYFNLSIFKPIAFLGQQSLSVYLLSGFYVYISSPLMTAVYKLLNITSYILTNTINSILCCIALSITSFFISKYLPIITGDYKGYRKDDSLTI